MITRTEGAEVINIRAWSTEKATTYGIGLTTLQGRDYKEKTRQRLHGRDRVTTVFGYGAIVLQFNGDKNMGLHISSEQHQGEIYDGYRQ